MNFAVEMRELSRVERVAAFFSNADVHETPKQLRRRPLYSHARRKHHAIEDPGDELEISSTDGDMAEFVFKLWTFDPVSNLCDLCLII